MKDAQKPDHVSLSTLINYLRKGRFAILDFQREFEWEPWDIRELMRSILLNYYIGGLLLWKGKTDNFAALPCEAIKFDQLAELRNGIRHSRTVGEVVRMEGEAAIVWFKQVLNK